MKILMIDDNTTELLKNEALLKMNKCCEADDQFYTYQSSEQFFKDFHSCSECDFDVAIIDYDLGPSSPNGYEVITEMQSNGYIGLAILLTGDDSSQMKLRMKLTSGIIYLHKENAVYTEICHLLKDVRIIK